MNKTLALPGVVLAAGLAAAALAPSAAQAAPRSASAWTAAAPASASAAPAAAVSSDAYFVGHLTGRNEVPVKGGPAVGDKNGAALVALRVSGDRVTYAVRWEGIAAPTAFHIHKGKAGVNGDVKIPFFGEALPGSARALAGTVKADRGLLASIKASPSKFYLNVHTGEFPGGAVRAQLERVSHPIDLAGVLARDTHTRLHSEGSGAQEVREPGKKVGDPDGASQWLVGVKGSKLYYATVWTRLDPVTNGHIHRGKRGKNGPVVVDLFADANGLPAGVYGIAGVAPVKGDIARGIVKTPKNWYTNLHTTGFPDGAVRGRLRSAHGSW
ncbi:CHRD domain-containing protein [Sphaerisporangium sp. NPDC005289]|uniref:CHRD domain-containing protein n=1 Tax=Sphaerisporangium sp. NPDC005289 TaxID=3155247 RepID=UPI0033B23912